MPDYKLKNGKLVTEDQLTKLAKSKNTTLDKIIELNGLTPVGEEPLKKQKDGVQGATAPSVNQAPKNTEYSLANGSLDLEKYNKIRSSFGYKPLSPNQYKEELDREVTIKEEEDITNYLEELTPGSKYDDKISEEVTNIYNSKLKSLPKTEFGTLDFDDEGITSTFYNNIISDFQNNNPVIQSEILPKIAPGIQEKTTQYANKLKQEMGLDDPNNVTDEAIDELKSKASDFYNKNINTELAKDKEFQAINAAFNNKVEELQGPSYKRFIQGKDSPNLLKFKDYSLTSGIAGMQTFSNAVENAYNTFRQVGNSLEDAGVRGYLGYQVEKEKHLENLQKRVDQYADDNIEGVWITDKQNLSGSWKFIPKQGVGWEGERMWRTIVAGNEYKEGTFADFKEAFGQPDNKDSYIGKEYSKVGKRLGEIQEKQLVLSQWDEGEFDKIMAGEDIVSNAIALAGEQLPQMALAWATYGISSGAQIGADIYSQGIDVEARKRFEIPDGESPTIEQLAEILKDDKFLSNLEAKAVGGGFIAGQLERFSAGKTLKAFTFASAKSMLRGGYKNFLKKVANGAVANTQNSLTESITEVLQEIIQSGATGANIDGQQLFKAGGTGFISSLTTGVAGNVKNQSAQEIKTISKIISGKLNPNSSEAFLNNKLKDLKVSFDNGEISEAAYNESADAIKSVRDANASIPKNFSEQSKKEALDLLIQKQELLSEIEGIDPDLATNAKRRIAEINTQLQVISETETDVIQAKKLIKKSGLEGDFTATETDQEFADQIASIKDSKGNRKYSDADIEAGKNSRFGVFIAEDGSIIVNKALAKRANVTTTARHELLHKIILAAVNSSSEGAKKIGSDLMAFVKSELGKSIKGDATNVLSNLEAYKSKAAQQIKANEGKLAKAKEYLEKGSIDQKAYDAVVKSAADAKVQLESNAFEEALTLMSEALANSDLVYNASFMAKVRDFIRRFLQTIPGAYGNIDLADGKATFDFIRDYNRLFDKGKFNKAFKEFAQTGTFKSEDIKESTKITPEQKKLNDKVDNLVGPKDADGNYTVTKAEWDTGALFNAYNEIINGTAIDALIMRGIEGDSVYGKSKQDFIDDVKDGITGTIMRFNPEENNSLIGFINSQLGFRKGDVLKKYKKEAGIGGKSIDVAAGETGSIAELVAEETAEDTLDAEAKMLQQEAELNKKPTFLESLPVDQKIEEGKTYQEALENETAERIKRNVQLYDQKVSQNRTISPFIAELKMDISDAFYKPTKKFINEYKGGYEGFLTDFKATLLNNYTTTYLARHPLFRKGILKRVKGQWMPPRKINKNGIFKYEWVDENGKKLKIDRDNAAGRGLTSGPEFIKRNPNINSVIGVNEFVDYHFQDGALRKKKKQNPEDAVARQIASETALEIFQNDLLENGPLTQLFEDRAELLGKILSDNAAITIASDIDRGLIKFSEKSMKQPKIAPIHNKALNILADQGPAAMDTYLETLKDQDVADLVKNYFDNRLWENGLFADAKARNRGLAYENYIKKVIRASKVKDVSVSMIGKKQKVGGDIILSIGKNKIPIELKLNDVAQMSSFTARIADDGTVSFSRKGLDDAAGVKDLKEILSSKDYAAKVKAFQDEGLKFAKDNNLYAEVINGRLVAQKAVFEYLVENGEQAKLNVTVDSNESIVNALYNDKDVYYMDLGNKGLFHLGEDVNKLNTPRLASPVQLYARWTRSSKIDGQDRYTASLRVFPNLTGDINKSTISLSDPANIKDVLNDLNFQEQNIKESNKIDTEINRMIQGVSGIPANEIVSKVRGTKLGKNKKGALFVPYSHEDFLGLMYPLVSKGKQGNADLDFIKQTILTPFAKAEHNITRERLNTAAEFRALKKQINKELGSTSLSKELGKEAIDGFTNEDAIRVWLWDNQQMDIPGLNEKDIAKIKNKVMKNPPLAMYALKLRGLLQGKYPEPGNNWEGGNISYDIQQNLENTRREFHLKTWQENVDKMFSPENKAKLEAAFGPKYVEALNNMLQRMKTGRNRTQNNTRIENALLDYLNGSVAAIMALNTKSALLQQLSNVNFINWTDNNPLKAAQAFANQPQYWRDVVDLLNSDYLRNRRSGLKINVTESELAEAAKSKNKVTAFIGLLGQKGFILTQYGDSFAIASGGATFFRNRLNTYLKESSTPVEELLTYNASPKSFNELGERSGLIYLAINKREAKAYADMNNGEVRNIYIDKNKIASEKELLDTMNELGIETSEGSTYELIDSRFEDFYIGKENMEKVTKALAEKGFKAARYEDGAQVVSEKVESIVVFDKSSISDKKGNIKSSGMSLADAKKQAFQDFSEISEDNQQSSRTDKISMQQASNLGRLFLAFANTPAQYARLTKKATLDLVNGRGDKKTNISKILYYGFVQNLYFSFLQKGLFSMLFDDDDEQEKNPKKAKQAFDMANSAFDSVLRGGGGIGGAAISMVKNLAIKAYEKSQKKQPMYSELAYQTLQVSPPISSKLTKLRQSGSAFDYNMWEIKNRGLALDNPALMAGARGTTAVTNIPLDRLVVKAQNMQNALNSDLETWQRVASALGWQGWELGIVDPKKEGETAKKKEEGKAKAKATRDQKAKEKKEAEEERLSKMTTQEIAYEEYQKRMKRKESGRKAAATRKRNKKSKDSLELEILKRSILKK